RKYTQAAPRPLLANRLIWRTQGNPPHDEHDGCTNLLPLKRPTPNTFSQAARPQDAVGSASLRKRPFLQWPDGLAGQLTAPFRRGPLTLNCIFCSVTPRRPITPGLILFGALGTKPQVRSPKPHVRERRTGSPGR